MNKLEILILLIIFLGGFAFLVYNNRVSAPKTPPNILSIPTISASPSDTIEPPTPTPIPTATPVPSQIPQATISAILKTNKGDIELMLYTNDAPNTVVNFIQKAKSGFYNNLTFHRVEDWVIQGGDPVGNGTGGGNMTTELNNKPSVVGSLGVARGGDIKISNDAQFFITKAEVSQLNGQYTNFGIVTKGMDVANQIQIGDKILGITVE